MHRAIAAWLIERPWRAALGTAVCGVLSLQMLLPFIVLAGAIPVLVALRFEAKLALSIAASGAAAAGWVLLSAGAGPWIVLGVAALLMSPAALGLLWRRTGSLNLCFQIAVLCTAVALGVVYLALPDPAALWLDLLRQVLESMQQAGLKLDGGVETLTGIWARTMWGALAALSLAVVLGGLFLGRWWACLLQSPGEFGAEYRKLRLGMALGLAVTVLLVIAVWSEAALVGSLAWVALTALFFQGLAAAHRSRANGSLNRGWLAAIYVLLIVPLSMSVTVFVLAIWGFADNWLRPRRTQGV